MQVRLFSSLLCVDWCRIIYSPIFFAVTEPSGYFLSTSFLSDVANNPPTTQNPVTFYDSNTGKPLFKAPIGRTWQDFVAESQSHGWPSFRDAEVDWDNVRVLQNGETVSVDGTIPSIL